MVPAVIPESNATSSAAEAGPARGHFRVGLRLSLVAISLFTVAFTALAVHVPWFFISRQNIADMAKQLNTEIVSGVSRELDDIFSSAVAAQQTIYDILRDGVIDIDDKRARDRLFFSFLNANPHFSWVSFGKPTGDFYGAQRRDDVNLRLVESKWNDSSKLAERTEDYYVNDGERISFTITKFKTNDYYSPGRSWYKRAIQNPEKHIWTDVYVFDTSKKPGLNTAKLFEHNGQVVGVISIAIELERISRYLQNLKSIRSGAAFIINPKGELIAFQDPREVTRPGKNLDEPELKPLSDSYHPMLRLAQEAIEGNGIDLATLSAPIQVLSTSGARTFVTLAPAGHEGWIAGTVIPESDFMATIQQNYLILLLVVLAALAVVGLVAVLVSRNLFIRPLRHIIRQTKLIERLDLSHVEHVPTRISEIDSLSSAVDQMSRGLSSFRKYLPGDLVQTLMSQGVVAELGGDRRTLTILFMDLEGFTSLSERLGHRMVPFLGDYLSAMSNVIMRTNGTIDKYIGDAVMAFWGAPFYNENHAADACRAALECAKAMEQMRVDWSRQGHPELRVRIGLNTGRVVVGNIGSNERLNYTVIGDPVNLSSRLEGMNKVFGTEILISQHTFELCKYDVVARRLDFVTVKGRDEPVAVYELLAMQDEQGGAAGFEWIPVFERALSLYRERRWAEAIQQFRKAIDQRGADRPSAVFIARCEEAMALETRLALPKAEAAE